MGSAVFSDGGASGHAVETVSGKRCSICGDDVSQKKRTKDQHGRYHCENCVAKRSVTAAAASTGQPRLCSNCGRQFGALEHGLDWDGLKVCSPCANSLQVERQVREKKQAELAAAEMARNEAEQASATKLQTALIEARRIVDRFRSGTVKFSAIFLIWLVQPIFFDWSWTNLPHEILQMDWMLVCALTSCLSLKRYFQHMRVKRALTNGEIEFASTGKYLGMSYAKVNILLILSLFLGTPLAIRLGDACGLLATRALATDATWPHTAAVLTAATLFLGVLAGICTYLHETACPKCRRYLLADTLGSEYLGSAVTGSLSRSEKVQTRDIYGRLIATSTVPTQPQNIITQKHRVFYRCRRCGHEWSKIQNRSHMA